MKQRIVTKDELWLEYKKAIDAGNFKTFKTREGFDGYLSREIKKKPGKEISFGFYDGYHITKCILKLSKEDILNADK